jgi:hypothetical protein
MMPAALSHSVSNYQCRVAPCSFTGQTLLYRQRMGSQEEHMVWDQRNEVRPALARAVREILGEEYARNLSFIYKLMHSEDIMDTLRLLHPSVYIYLNPILYT